MNSSSTSSYNKWLIVVGLFLVMVSMVWFSPTQAAHKIDCRNLPQEVVEGQSRWQPQELTTLCQLWIGSLPPVPDDPSNAYDTLPEAADFGHELFFDTRLSADGTISCATCHQPNQSFTDGLPVGVGIGEGERNTMTLVGTSYSPWLFWDGHKDSLWSQALESLESSVEHALTRSQVIQVIVNDENYRKQYTAIFGDLTDFDGFPEHASPVGDDEARLAWEGLSEDQQREMNTVFVNVGKAIAAYERQLQYGESPFDQYVASLLHQQPTENILDDEQISGLQLFIGKAQCINCHNGALFTNNAFHNTGVQISPVRARLQGARDVVEDEFNCLGAFSDADSGDCAELRFIVAGRESFGAWRTPSLRNITETAPYMHAGQFDTLEDVLNHYNTRAVAEHNERLGHLELLPINLTEAEEQQIIAFLEALTAPLNTPDKYLNPPD